MANPIYTTTDAVMRRLRGRLEQTQASALGRTVVDQDLLPQVICQAEQRLNNVLGQRYKLPLQDPTHPSLAEYTELQSVCQLIPIHFQQQSVSSDKGLSEIVCKQASDLLEAFKNGEILLPGEELIPEPVAGFNTGTTFVRQRTPGVAEAIDFLPDTARGCEWM